MTAPKSPLATDTGHGTLRALKAHRAANEPLCEHCETYHAWWLDAHGWGPLDLRPCGTLAAYRRHQRRGERIDTACRQANSRALADREARLKAGAA